MSLLQPKIGVFFVPASELFTLTGVVKKDYCKFLINKVIPHWTHI